jgi:hypothetical protein
LKPLSEENMLRQTIGSMIKIAIPFLFLLAAGCTANFYVTPDDFIKQVSENQKKSQSMVFLPAAPLFFASRYDANNIRKILCKDKDGNLVYLFPDRNTQLEITSKSTKDLVKMYFDTVFFEGNTLVGLRSRLIPGMTREIDLTDIEKIEIYAEFPRTEKYQMK